MKVDDFASTEALRDFILDERGREFHTEALRRQDLIRHGKFIEMAIERGKPAKDFHVRYPIPQTEIERNSNLTQNEGIDFRYIRSYYSLLSGKETRPLRC